LVKAALTVPDIVAAYPDKLQVHMSRKEQTNLFLVITFGKKNIYIPFF